MLVEVFLGCSFFQLGLTIIMFVYAHVSTYHRYLLRSASPPAAAYLPPTLVLRSFNLLEAAGGDFACAERKLAVLPGAVPPGFEVR